MDILGLIIIVFFLLAAASAGEFLTGESDR